MILEEMEFRIHNPLTVLAAAIDTNSIDDINSDGTAIFCIGEAGNEILSDELGVSRYDFKVIIDVYFPDWNKIIAYNSEEEPKIIPVSAQLTESNRAVYQILLDRLVSLATQEFFDCNYLWQKSENRKTHQ